MRLIFVLIFASISFLIGAQSAADAEVYFDNKQYSKAKNIFEVLIKRKPNDALLNYKLARCFYELKDFTNAALYFENSSSKYPLKDWYLAESYFKLYRFELSIATYQAFQATLEPTDPKVRDCEIQLKKAELGQKLMNRVEEISIIDSVVVNKNDFVSVYNIGNELGKLAQQRIKINNKTFQDKIAFTTPRNDRKLFSDSIKGNMDIFTSFKLLDEWTLPISVSNIINTRANENFPFLLLDGITMYFASDGENSLGGYDIFITKYSASTKDFLTPENVGFPFNSTANDYLMAIDEQHSIGWFATDRNQTSGKVIIYKFAFNVPRVYFKSDDIDSLSNVAQLRTYKLSKSKYTKSDNQTNKAVLNSKIQNQIIINDSTVYTSAKQFQSPNALQIYNESMLILNELSELESTLSELRAKYDLEEISDKKSSLTEQIKTFEPRVLILKKTFALKSIQATNTESLFLFPK
ncbi:MAG: tetratricopeptide repeat protein [Paludibacter sp.]